MHIYYGKLLSKIYSKLGYKISFSGWFLFQSLVNFLKQQVEMPLGWIDQPNSSLTMFLAWRAKWRRRNQVTISPELYIMQIDTATYIHAFFASHVCLR